MCPVALGINLNTVLKADVRIMNRKRFFRYIGDGEQVGILFRQGSVVRTDGEIAIVGKDLPATPSAFHLHGQIKTGPIDTGEGTEVIRVSALQIEGIGQEIKADLAIIEDVVAVGVRNGGIGY